MSRTAIKILSYNIHKGFSALNKRLVLAGIKESIRTLNADIVFLQEVIGHHELHAQRHETWPTQTQFEFLADTTWPHYAYGKNAVYTSGHHGNAFLSAFPIVQWSNTNISTNQWENRGLLHAVIEIPTTQKKIHCFCIHLSLFQSGREQQMLRITETINEQVPRDEPLIVAGDFNDWRMRVSDRFAKQVGVTEAFSSHQGNYAKTYPSIFPFLCLDRIYTRGFTIHETKILHGSPWQQLSDHIPLYAELSF